MKYPQIAALVPEGEHFDESALINEGGFITLEHLNSINNALAAQETIAADLQEAIQRESDLTQVLENARNTIASMQIEIDQLKAAPSGTGTSLNSTADDQPPAPLPSYLSDVNPINSWVDKKLNRK